MVCLVLRLAIERADAGRPPLPGARIFGQTNHSFQELMRRLLTLLEVEGAARFTLEGFRAGKASALIASGLSLKQTMEAGEWRTLSVASYLDESVIDASRVLAALEEASEDETE